jgi:GNAT superfamily N-acetyltransferase
MRAKEFIVEYKKYPTAEYEGLRISMVEKDGQLIVKALDDWGVNEVGYVVFNVGDNDELDPQDLRVEDKYQGQGIAKVMYDYVTSHGYEIHRSYDQTDAGAGFWNKHRGEKRVWEEVNPDIYHSDFKHELEIHGYRYTAEVDNNSGYGNQLIIKVYDGNEEIANAEFIEEPHDKALISANTWVSEEYQGQHIATNMYAYAKMLGNDIVPSWNQTDAGERMWRSWNQSGQSKHILPKGQKGYR